MVSMCPKTLENWYFGSLYIETIGFRRPAHKKGFFILWDTLMLLSIQDMVLSLASRSKGKIWDL